MDKLNIKIFGIHLFDILSIISRLILGVVFLFAAYEKIPHIGQFQANVANYHMLPSSIVPQFSFILPWIELIVGLYLILGIFSKYTSIFTIFLLIIFMIAISYAIKTNQPVTGCGCFAQSGGDKIGWIDIFRDLFFILLAAIILLTDSTFLSIDKFLKKEHIDGKNKESSDSLKA